MCSPLCVFVVDVPKKANAFGGKIRRKPNPKGAQASTRVIPNAPPVRFQSVCRAICRRPSWHVWACPSLTEARPSAARQKPVAGPWRVRRVSRSDHSHGRRWTRRRPQSAASPCEPPRTNATRTNTRRTPHRTRPNDERTQNEQPTNTDAPARQATLSTPPTVNRPCVVRQKPVVGRSPRDRRPSIVRILSVSCPSCVRDMTFVSPCSGRQRACSHKGSRSLDEIHYAIWRIFTGGIASSSDFMGRKGPFSGVPVVSNSEQFSLF